MAIAATVLKKEAPQLTGEELLDYELSKRILLERLSDIVRAKWKDGSWLDDNGEFMPHVLLLNYTYDSAMIEQEQIFIEKSFAQFFAEILGIWVDVQYLKKLLPCGGYTCRFEIRKRGDN